ncbi:IclR family transcriptional regulator [Paenarthrobacter sp. NPDC089714]|uniref:IclR family transcriptional regulator n=1 Tax=Paenarthrobacter sp. NPDC089714 TaxID=3364377 RepID=UPI0038156906
MVVEAEGAGGRILSSATRCLELVDWFAGAEGPLSIGDLAELTGDRKGTIHQRVQTLLASGWVEQLPDARYRLTLRSVVIGAAVLEQADLGSRAVPVLKELSAATGETSTLSAFQGEGALVIQEVRTDKPLRLQVRVGTALPLDLSAAGQALATFATRDELAHAQGQGAKLPQAERISQARARGYALQEDGFIEGISSVAMVATPTLLGSVALAVTAPSTRFDLESYLEPLREACTRISALLPGR